MTNILSDTEFSGLKTQWRSYITSRGHKKRTIGGVSLFSDGEAAVAIDKDCFTVMSPDKTRLRVGRNGDRSIEYQMVFKSYSLDSATPVTKKYTKSLQTQLSEIQTDASKVYPPNIPEEKWQQLEHQEPNSQRSNDHVSLSTLAGSGTRPEQTTPRPSATSKVPNTENRSSNRSKLMLEPKNSSDGISTTTSDLTVRRGPTDGAPERPESPPEETQETTHGDLPTNDGTRSTRLSAFFGRMKINPLTEKWKGSRGSSGV